MLWQLCQKNDSAGCLLEKGWEKLMGRLEVTSSSWPLLQEKTGGKVGLGNVVWGQRGAVAECTTKSHFEMDALMALGLIKSLDWYCKWALYLMTSAAFLCTHPEITVSSVEPVTSPDGGIMFCSLLSNSTFIPLQNPPLGSLRQMSPQLPPLFLCLWVIHTVDSTSGGIHQA